MGTEVLPPQLVRAANTILRSKVPFGSDFPVISPDRWLADFEKLAIKDDVRPLILEENAIRVLRLCAAQPRCGESAGLRPASRTGN